MFSIDGIVSGFETSTIIESLLGFQQTQIDTYTSRKLEITEQQTAFKSIEAQLVTLRGSLGRLNRTSASVFQVQNATSSDESILVAAADGEATNGTFNLTVNSLATAHQIGSQGFASSTAEIATGEIDFKVGDRAAQTITIDSTNNTLSGLATEINNQLDDISASIVFDQGADSYRLLLTSAHSGIDNQISVTSSLAGGTVPDFSGAAIQEASNAEITLGSGPGAITASYASNQVEGLIENVTLDLKSADPTKTITIDVSNDHEPAKEAVTAFVDEFNAIMDFIDDQTRFVAEANQASPLLGNRNVNELQSRMRQLAIDTVDGLDGTSNRLSVIGVEITDQGKLSINSATLDKAFNGEIEGLDPKDIPRLFGLNGTSNHVGIEFLAGSTRTVDSNVPYEVNITQAAEQAVVTATTALTDSIVVSASDNEFQITLDGIVSETLTLESGTYTRDEFASHVQSVINSSTELGNHRVEVSLSSNALVVRSVAYGTNSRISSISGSASSLLGFDGTEAATGENVKGEFIVDGQVEIAEGTGQLLVGDSDNENTADLQVLVTMTPDQVVAGNEGELLITRGVTGKLDQYLNELLDSENGTLKTIDDAFQSRIDSIDRSIETVQEITDSKREFLIREFTALESIINELQTTGNFISSQLQTISSSSNNNRN